jgi:hypothetical protein
MEDGTSPPAPGWLAQLAGNTLDLGYWEQSLKPPFDPSCERILQGDNSIFVLRSHTFADAQNANEVRERALSLTDRLNGALAVVEGAEPLSLQAVGRIDEKGAFHLTIFLEAARIRLRGGRVLISTGEVRDAAGNLVPPPPPQPSEAQRWAEAAEQNYDIADMLVFAGRADNWFDIYKAIELAERLSGGRHELAKLPGDSRAKCENMRETANFHRHARTHRPKILTDLSDAKGLLSFIVRTVLARRAG